MKLYELVGKDRTQGFSPYVWRTRMALAHKGLEVEMIPLTFTEIANVADGISKTVPILEHDGSYVSDSWNIACYLEDSFPDSPSLFGGEQGQAYANFFNFVSFYNLLVPLFPALVFDIFEGLDEKDQNYFRRSREARLGKSLEEAHANQDQALRAFQKQLYPYNATLKTQAFLSGSRPAYVDYIMYGLFQWAKGVSALTLLSDDEPLYQWRTRMDELYDGLGQVIKAKS
ncbi:MAG: glutathione S-transferase N-terminal domain-containing protein [Emcibacter sp.]|nr:glutathione S-transferase N-terminal domain-containing protein [Emcibacter sp.]